MAVYYRYRSGVDTFSVPVPAPSISVADLKRLILGTSRHGHGRTRGRGPRESVALSDARTGEEYADDGALVPRGSTVVVRRIAGPPAETITVKPPSPPPNDGAASSDSAARSGSTAQDDEDRAISAVIDAARLTWEHHRPYQGGRPGAQDQRAPPAGYVCHRCRVPGHFIQHCPTNGDPRFDFGRASSSAAHLPAPTPASTVPDDDDGIPPELHCRMCKKVMADAVVTSRCCFDSFCDACIRGRIVAEAKCVCGAPARTDDLVPNQTLRVTIANMLAARAAAGASGGSDNQKSSAGSNEEPCKSQSPDAAKGSRSQVTAACSEHSDGSASSSTSKIEAAHQPRTKQATAAESTQTMARGGYPEQYGCGGPFGPAFYDPFYGGMPWTPDPYMYYGVPFAGAYPIVPVPAGYHDGGHGRKRTADGEGRRREEPGLKRMCRSRSMVAV